MSSMARKFHVLLCTKSGIWPAVSPQWSEWLQCRGATSLQGSPRPSSLIISSSSGTLLSTPLPSIHPCLPFPSPPHPSTSSFIVLNKLGEATELRLVFYSWLSGWQSFGHMVNLCLVCLTYKLPGYHREASSSSGSLPANHSIWILLLVAQQSLNATDTWLQKFCLGSGWFLYECPSCCPHHSSGLPSSVPEVILCCIHRLIYVLHGSKL